MYMKTFASFELGKKFLPWKSHSLSTGISLALSSVSAFFIWFLKSKAGVIVFEAVFNFIFISGWNGLDIASTEAFPTHIRYWNFSIVYWMNAYLKMFHWIPYDTSFWRCLQGRINEMPPLMVSAFLWSMSVCENIYCDSTHNWCMNKHFTMYILFPPFKFTLFSSFMIFNT